MKPASKQEKYHNYNQEHPAFLSIPEYLFLQVRMSPYIIQCPLAGLSLRRNFTDFAICTGSIFIKTKESK